MFLREEQRIAHTQLICFINIKNLIFATVAQLVEQRIRNAQAVGSSPTSSSKNGYLYGVRFLFAIIIHMQIYT